MQRLGTLEALIACLEALIEGDMNITANEAGRFFSTRTSNLIRTYRGFYGLEIITQRVETDNGKWYGRYLLGKGRANRAKAIKTLTLLKRERTGENAPAGAVA